MLLEPGGRQASVSESGALLHFRIVGRHSRSFAVLLGDSGTFASVGLAPLWIPVCLESHDASPAGCRSVPFFDIESCRPAAAQKGNTQVRPPIPVVFLIGLYPQVASAQ